MHNKSTGSMLKYKVAWLGFHFRYKFMNIFNVHFTPKILYSDINIPPYLFSDVIAVVGFVWRELINKECLLRIVELWAECQLNL